MYLCHKIINMFVCQIKEDIFGNWLEHRQLFEMHKNLLKVETLKSMISQ